jgi:hypothetical protein
MVYKTLMKYFPESNRQIFCVPTASCVLWKRSDGIDYTENILYYVQF